MEKNEIREFMSLKKKEFKSEELKNLSIKLLKHIEEDTAFRSAKTVMLYHSLPDEVNTHDFIEKWHREKTIILPVVSGNDILLRVYHGKDSMKKGAYNIDEPQGEEFTDFSTIDMIIVPGVAFDRNYNRLGRGKGYYDRFLKRTDAMKIGICFSFQLLKNIPTDKFDVPMDKVYTENGCISKILYQQ